MRWSGTDIEKFTLEDFLGLGLADYLQAVQQQFMVHLSSRLHHSHHIVPPCAKYVCVFQYKLTPLSWLCTQTAGRSLYHVALALYMPSALAILAVQEARQ